MKKIIFLMAAAALCQMGLSAHSHSHHHNHFETYRGESLAGLYNTVSVFQSGDAVSTVYGTASFHKDGSYESTDTNQLGTVSTADANGLLSTTRLGQWKRTGRNTYEIFSTSVVSAVNDTPNQFPTTPSNRRAIIGTLVYSPSTNTYQATYSVYVYALTDTALTNGTLFAQITSTGTKLNKLQ